MNYAEKKLLSPHLDLVSTSIISKYERYRAAALRSTLGVLRQVAMIPIRACSLRSIRHRQAHLGKQSLRFAEDLAARAVMFWSDAVCGLASDLNSPASSTCGLRVQLARVLRFEPHRGRFWCGSAAQGRFPSKPLVTPGDSLLPIAGPTLLKRLRGERSCFSVVPLLF